MTTLFHAGKPIYPSGFRVRPTSYRELEQVANELWPMLPKARGEKFRLDCGRILEQTLQQAGFFFRTGTIKDMPDCAAFTVPDDDLIVFREDIYDQVREDHVFGRSTVIHEMAHIVLKHAATLRRGSPSGQHRHCEDSEWQAKALTAALMMPVSICRSVGSASELARECGTSVQAATYRLDRLVQEHIIKPKDLYRGQI